ncbi:MAG: hypothetical protein ABI599_09810 [Flavobacteriales bacterium]
MKHIFLTAGLAFSTICTIAQTGVIAKQNGANSAFYYAPGQDLAYAVQQAAPGDTLYLPGGILPYNGITINKRLTIIGAGYHANGVPVTQKTVIPSTFSLSFVVEASADGSSFHGIDFEENIAFSTAVMNIDFVRCEFNDISLDPFSTVGAQNISFRQCVFRDPLGIEQSESIYVYNSVFEQGVYITNYGSASQVQIKQCLFLNASLTNAQVNGVEYENNVFVYNQNSGTIQVNCIGTLRNNVFVANAVLPVTITPLGVSSGNSSMTCSPANAQFVNLPSLTTYVYNSDLQLQSCADAFPGFGGYEVGVYGGPAGSTWKENGIPFNPHWETLITPANTINGVLPAVQIQGSAQTN